MSQQQWRRRLQPRHYAIWLTSPNPLSTAIFTLVLPLQAIEVFVNALVRWICKSQEIWDGNCLALSTSTYLARLLRMSDKGPSRFGSLRQKNCQLVS